MDSDQISNSNYSKHIDNSSNSQNINNFIEIPKISILSTPNQINKSNNNFIFIGKKPIINYLNSIKLVLKNSEISKIILKARGKFISKAVDIAELAKRNPDFKLSSNEIKISTEEYQKEIEPPEKTNQKIKISVIEIHLSIK